MNLDLATEIATIALCKALTGFVDRWGYGGFLADPEAAGARHALYAKAGLAFTDAQDRDAARRLKIWHFNVRRLDPPGCVSA